MEDLLEFLSRQGRGPIVEIGKLAALLETHWLAFEGNDQVGWMPISCGAESRSRPGIRPFLEYVIERHGATVRGSTRARAPALAS